MRLENNREKVRNYLSCLNFEPDISHVDLRVATDLGALVLPERGRFRLVGVRHGNHDRVTRVPRPGHPVVPARPDARPSGGIFMANTARAHGSLGHRNLSVWLTPPLEEHDILSSPRNSPFAQVGHDGQAQLITAGGDGQRLAKAQLIRFPVDEDWLRRNKAEHNCPERPAWFVYIGKGALTPIGRSH